MVTPIATTITTTPNIPMRHGDRLTVHERDGRCTVYTVVGPQFDLNSEDWGQRADTHTVAEYNNGRRVIHTVVDRLYWDATVERHEPLWKAKQRIRAEVAREMRGELEAYSEWLRSLRTRGKRSRRAA